MILTVFNLPCEWGIHLRSLRKCIKFKWKINTRKFWEQKLIIRLAFDRLSEKRLKRELLSTAAEVELKTWFYRDNCWHIFVQASSELRKRSLKYLSSIISTGWKIIICLCTYSFFHNHKDNNNHCEKCVEL